LDFEAICFKSHNWIIKRPVSFQSAILELRKAISVYVHYDNL
jgi:hypothetical protein